MPELPEVEVLVRHFAIRLPGRTIRDMDVRDRRSLRQTDLTEFKTRLIHSRFHSVERRGKYLLFTLRKRKQSFLLLGHLGMSGRMYLVSKNSTLKPHATIVFFLGSETLVFEDTRRFGGMSLNASAIDRLGPEPLDPEFTADTLCHALARTNQSIKTKLLDQSLVA